MTGKKLILIGHSLGGVLIETYMRVYSDWQSDIEKFIALNVPFDGSSGYVLQSAITGYNLQLPIPFTIMKNIEASSGS